MGKANKYIVRIENHLNKPVQKLFLKSQKIVKAIISMINSKRISMKM